MYIQWYIKRQWLEIMQCNGFFSSFIIFLALKLASSTAKAELISFVSFTLRGIHTFNKGDESDWTNCSSLHRSQRVLKRTNLDFLNIFNLLIDLICNCLNNECVIWDNPYLSIWFGFHQDLQEKARWGYQALEVKMVNQVFLAFPELQDSQVRLAPLVCVTAAAAIVEALQLQVHIDSVPAMDTVQHQFISSNIHYLVLPFHFSEDPYYGYQPWSKHKN